MLVEVGETLLSDLQQGSDVSLRPFASRSDQTQTCVPWCEDGVVQEVLENLSVGGVGGLRLQVLRRFGTGAAQTQVRSISIRFSGLGVLFLVPDTRGSNSEGDLEL